MSGLSDFNFHEILTENNIRQLLQPLQHEKASDYARHYKAMMEFAQRLRSLETLYADVYSKVSLLEEEIVQLKYPDSP
jgi:hypothetical protein